MFEAESVLARVLNGKCEHLFQSYCILFCGRETIVTDQWTFPTVQDVGTFLPGITDDLLYLGKLYGQPCYGTQCRKLPDVLPSGFQRVLTRRLLTEAEEHLCTRSQKQMPCRRHNRKAGGQRIFEFAREKIRQRPRKNPRRNAKERNKRVLI